ncbi:hypothetical protein C1645_741031 [Glomus cerebriforme]|uniref:Uncharacterized protein n=1 Tax=Glomus cerebriforme TaxID=658196 RepID=A0A397SJ55_9GLOM|nr:hypothetical protein C1645_741031 [Glomus cerebriforme]
MYPCSWKYGEWEKLYSIHFGAQNVRIGHSTESETDTVTIHNIKGPGGFYIDTPGFDDSDESKVDDEVKRSISCKMLETNVQNITTILCLPSTSIYVRENFTNYINDYDVYKGSEPERILAKYESLMEDISSVRYVLDLKKSSVLDVPKKPIQATTKQVFDDSPEAWTVRVFSFGGVNPNLYLDTGSVVIITMLIHMDASNVKKFTKKRSGGA